MAYPWVLEHTGACMFSVFLSVFLFHVFLSVFLFAVFLFDIVLFDIVLFGIVLLDVFLLSVFGSHREELSGEAELGVMD